jgi:ubiquinone/menaquinone biosynthesis C-methylase UbiE
MILNTLEYLGMNNPVRGWHQDVFEARFMRRHSALAPGARVLEVGCGNGNGTRLIRKYFRPGRISAVDLDPRMLRLARRLNSHPSVDFSLADASRLPFGDGQFDAVFDFGIVHHIPEWRVALDEIDRVLKPGGEFLFEELCSDSFLSRLGPLVKRVTDHPYAQMFSAGELKGYLEAAGFSLGELSRIPVFGIIDLYAAVAKKGR